MFKLSRTYQALTLSLLCMAWLPSHADSFASSASSAGSASSGSVSDSIGDSSQSSSGDKKVAAGEYRITEVAAVAERPGVVRLTLRATAPGPVREFFLHLPAQALAIAREKHPLDVGARVQVSERSYGYEFAHAANREAFFLALTQDAQRDLASQVVRL